ncbi:MAG: hypothetical protein K9N21_07140 [Deltaproteobacteria bacterium]|nr:hypothetical protein [Deltaproteobacteria bacterium]
MKRICRTWPGSVVRNLPALLILMGMVSCATTIPELQVRYTLPTQSDTLKGRAVALTIEDRRSDKSILGKGAHEEFKGFSNSVALKVAEPDQKGTSVGIFQVPTLMREAFTRRLARSGVRVLSDKTAGVPGLEIVLKTFSLDLAGREWLAKMSYEARLTGERGAVATQFINGEAKRYKVIGRDSADTLMGEIFTDMVNSLDVARLFKQAGL